MHVWRQKKRVFNPGLQKVGCELIIIQTITLKTARDMKIFLLVLLTVAAVADELDPNYSYDDFYRQFNRTYTGEEKASHKQIFDDKFRELKKLREQGQDAVVNDFMDWNQTQLDSFFNYNPNSLNLPLSERPLTANQLFAAPTEFDWRTYDRITPVKNQGGCGSCWAFAATAHYESLLAIATNGVKYALADQYALQCDTTSFRCNGGYPNSALKLFMNQGGIPLQSTYPYNYSTNYSNICSDPNRIKLNKTINGVYYFGSMTIEQLQQDLVDYGPINVGVLAGSTFQSAGSTGMINCPVASGINHAVLLVGYTATHWIIKNSWGTGWGASGFGYINKSADCNIRTYINEMRVNMNVDPTPTPAGSIKLSISMTDSYGDGWNGNVLAIKQNDAVVGTFGSLFTTGTTSGPVFITVQGNVEAKIVVSTFGTWTEEVGFTVTAPNGTEIYRRNSGSQFKSDILFKSFCPVDGCPVVQTVTYQLSMTDAWGDGWEGTTLAFKQEGVVISTFNLPSGSAAGPIDYTFKKLVNVDIVVYVLGSYTNEVGFVLRNSAGAVVFQRTAGTSFSAGSILGSFCPECLNLSPVSIAQLPDTRSSKQQPIVQTIQNRGYMIATFVLASVLAIFMIALGITVFKYVKLSKKVSEEVKEKVPDDNPSAKSITASSVEVMKNI